MTNTSCFSAKRFCMDIRVSETILLSVLSTYSLDMAFVLSEYESLLGSDLLIFHGSQTFKESEDDAWVKYKSDPCMNNTAYVRYVNPLKTRVCMNGEQETISSGGVHHPKYVLIFTDKGLHVAITTANLVRDNSVNATWSHYFERCTNDIKDVSDFGLVLENFLSEVAQYVMCQHFVF